jgi:hypothetical protein
MKKNVAGQKTGAQLITAADGTAFTGAVTVSVTGDAGTQATGSVGSGACTHEGNGYHTYAPAQAETNYDLVAFTYTGTGAIPVTIQIYTSFPQSADAPTAAANADAVWDEVRSGHTTVGTFGEVVEAADIADAVWEEALADHEATVGSTAEALATAGGSGASAADIADAVLDEAMSGHVTAGTLGKAVADILVDTGTTLDTAITTIDTVVDAIKLKTDNLPADPASETNVDAVETKVDIVDTVADAIKVKTDQMNFTGVANRLNVNQTHINEIEVGGSGTALDPWGPV